MSASAVSRDGEHAADCRWRGPRRRTRRPARDTSRRDGQNADGPVVLRIQQPWRIGEPAASTPWRDRRRALLHRESVKKFHVRRVSWLSSCSRGLWARFLNRFIGRCTCGRCIQSSTFRCRCVLCIFTAVFRSVSRMLL